VRVSCATRKTPEDGTLRQHGSSAPRAGIVSRIPLAAVVLILTGQGCASLPEAPTELSSLSTWLFRNFESEDPELLGVGLGNLQAFLEGRGVDDDYDDQAWEIAPLAEADVADVTHPDREPSAALPVGLVAVSAYPPAEHTRVVVLTDQTPVEPASPELYERSFLEPTDPACFPDQACDLLRTDNRIRKENLLMSIEYSKRKDYRHARVLRGDMDPQHGVIGRSWFEEEALGEQEATAIHQSYSIDVFLPDGAGGGWRYVALWTEASMYGAGDDIIQATMRDGLEDMLVATEAWLDGQAR
jgi:hypothetical protein